MVPQGDGTFELILVVSIRTIIAYHSLRSRQSTTFSIPNVVNTKVKGVEAYATSDLLMPHPAKSGYWKIYGRLDDQIMHNTGEKVRNFSSEKRGHSLEFCQLQTNPGPLGKF
jgi:hypothetical protein